MIRTKWMRLAVRDPADVLRWAGAQRTRRLDQFRYRVIHGREFVSFRMVPRYSIQVGTSDIVVMAHVRPGRWQRLAAAVAALRHGAARRVSAALKPQATAPASSPRAELYQFAALRLSSPSRR